MHLKTSVTVLLLLSVLEPLSASPADANAAPPEAGWELVGVVQDDEGRPLAGGSVAWLPSSTSCEEGEPPAPRTVPIEEDGLFRLEAPASVEAVDLLVRSPDHGAEILARQVEPPSVILRPGVVLAGRVTDRIAEEGVEAARLRLLPHEPEGPASVFVRCAPHLPGELYPTAESGTDGAFRLTARPGLWDLHLAAPSHVDRVEEKILLEAGGREGLELDLHPAFVLRGTVQDPDGEAVAGATIRPRIDVLALRAQGMGALRRTGSFPTALGELEATTDGAGVYVLEEVPAGLPLRVTARKEGLAEEARSLKAPKKGAVEILDLVLTPGVRVAGRLLDETGAPVSGAGVSLRPPAEEEEVGTLRRAFFMRRAALRRDGEDLPTTDAEGRFTLEGVAPGQWRPLAVVSGRAQDTEDGILEVPDEGLTEVDLRVRLGPAVRGRVLDDRGQPVEEAVVQARTGERLRGAFLRAKTDTAGRFTLRLEEGAETVSWLRVGKEGYGFATRGDLMAGEAPVEIVLSRAGGAEGLVLGPDGAPLPAFRVAGSPRGESRSLSRRLRGRPTVEETVYDEDGQWRLEDLAPGTWDLTFEAEGLAPERVEGIEISPAAVTPVAPVTLSEGAVLRGTVVASGTDLPVAGARIELTGGGTLRLGEPPGDGTVESDAGGGFELRGVPPGIHTLQAHHPDYPTATVRGVRVTEGEEPPPLTIHLARGGAIEGTVTGGGAPRAGLTLEARGGRGTEPRSAVTDPAGRYRMEALPAGRWTVTLQGESSERRWKNAEVVEGETVTLDFGDEEPGVLHGRVHRAGRAVEGAQLLLLPAARMPALDTRETTSELEGRYRFEDLPAGTYRLLVVPPGESAPDSSPLTVRIEAGEWAEHEIELPSLPLEGIVRDGTSGQGITGANVVATPAGDPLAPGRGGRGVHATTTDSSGRFHLDLAAPGAWRLSVSHRDHVRESLEVEVPEQGRSDVDIELEPSGTLQGRLLDAQGLPLPGALVQSVAPVVTTRTDEGGRFVLDGLPDETVRLRLLAAGAAPDVVEVSPPFGEERTWTLEEGGALLVRLDAAPPVREAARLRLLSPEGRDMSWILARGRSAGIEDRLRREGWVRLPHLQEGSWRVVVDAAGGRASSAAQVSRGSETVLELRF